MNSNDLCWKCLEYLSIKQKNAHPFHVYYYLSLSSLFSPTLVEKNLIIQEADRYLNNERDKVELVSRKSYFHTTQTKIYMSSA